MTFPMPTNAPAMIRDQAKLTALEHEAAKVLRVHDESAASAGLSECPCSFCANVRPWVTG